MKNEDNEKKDKIVEKEIPGRMIYTFSQPIQTENERTTKRNNENNNQDTQ